MSRGKAPSNMTAPMGTYCESCHNAGGHSIPELTAVCEDCCGSGRNPIPFLDIMHHFVACLRPDMWKKEGTR